MGAVSVEIVYALPEGADAVRLAVPPGTSLAGAIAASGLLERHPEIDLARLKAGVFGRLKDPHAPVAQGERIEIYRPLGIDPKEARRRRARRARKR